MIKHRILIVGTYPIINPQHGGQKRTEAIFNAYKKSFKDVKYLSVVPGKYYPIKGRNDVAVSSQTMEMIDRSPILSDIICGEAIYEDQKVRKRFTKAINAFKPTIIHIEQIYPYMGLQKVLNDLGFEGKLINGTQNIEYLMKDEIYKSSMMDATTAKNTIEKIKNTEKLLARAATINVAVSVEDADVLSKTFGAKNILLAANAINPPEYQPRYINKWRNYFKSSSISQTVLFVGSAHQPNMSGFQEMIGGKIGFLPRNTKILVVGGVSDLIKRSLKPESIEDTCLPLRVDFLGRVGEKDLSSLIHLSDTIILPITQGGGSNLKTAEALLSKKNIVATAHAFRGYERYKSLDNVWIADRPDQFRSYILKSLNSKDSYANPSDDFEDLRWENALADLINGVQKI